MQLLRPCHWLCLQKTQTFALALRSTRPFIFSSAGTHTSPNQVVCPRPNVPNSNTEICEKLACYQQSNTSQPEQLVTGDNLHTSSCREKGLNMKVLEICLPADFCVFASWCGFFRCKNCKLISLRNAKSRQSARSAVTTRMQQV